MFQGPTVERNPQTELAYLQPKIYLEICSAFLDYDLELHVIRLIWRVIRYLRESVFAEQSVGVQPQGQRP